MIGGDSKRCSRCCRTKAVGEFYSQPSKRDGLSVFCVECQRASVKRSEQALRAEVLALLGDACARCGFDDPRALQIDHVEGGGRADRAACGGPRGFYRRVLRDADGYALLCANCNFIKRAERNECTGSTRERLIPTRRTSS